MHLNKIKVGIAEDHKLILKALASVLKKTGCVDIVFEASNGQQLLKELEIKSVDIILLDIQMPIMDGLKALECIGNNWPELKVIIYSSFNDIETIQRAYKGGARAFLNKTLDANELMNAFAAVTENGVYCNNLFTEEIIKKNGDVSSIV
jgi:DNA-binding NarL/FixJ family response regulator